MGEQFNWLDPETGVVHAQRRNGDGDFTFCDRPGDGDEICDGFEPKLTKRPVNCRACREEWLEMKRVLGGIRWSRDLIQGDPTDV